MTRARRWGAVAAAGAGVLMLTGCLPDSGVWWRLGVDGSLEVSPCRDLGYDEIVLTVTMDDDRYLTETIDAPSSTLAAGDSIRIPWSELPYDLEAEGWELASVGFDTDAGHRSNLFAPGSREWKYGAVGGMFIKEADSCTAPEE